MSRPPESQWHLRVMDDGGSEVDIPVCRAPKCIGRDEQRVDIRLLSAQVSRRHAEVWIEADGCLMVRDLKSTNGTEVNGRRLEAEPRSLLHGDMLRIARWEFIACDRAAADAVAAQKAEVLVSSADSIAALDALLDSRGNLRHEEVVHSAAAKPSVAGSSVRQPAQPVVERMSPPVREVRIADDLEAAGQPSESIMGGTLCGGTMAALDARDLLPAPKPAQAASRPVPAVAGVMRAPREEAPAAQPAAAEPPMALLREDAATIAADSGIVACSTVDDFVDSQAGKLLFGGSQAGTPALDDSCSGVSAQPAARARDLHLVGEGRAPGVSAADLCAVQAFAERQLVVPDPAKRQRLLCEFAIGPVFRKNLSAVVAIQDGKVVPVGAPLSSLPGVGLHIEKTLVRCAAREKRAVVAWDAHFQGGASAVAVCCPLASGEFLYSVTTFENATPAWMSLVAQTAFMDRLIRKSWAAIEKVRRPAALPMGAAA